MKKYPPLILILGHMTPVYITESFFPNCEKITFFKTMVHCEFHETVSWLWPHLTHMLNLGDIKINFLTPGPAECQRDEVL
jgi:hypothetical protein